MTTLSRFFALSLSVVMLISPVTIRADRQLFTRFSAQQIDREAFAPAALFMHGLLENVSTSPQVRPWAMAALSTNEPAWITDSPPTVGITPEQLDDVIATTRAEEKSHRITPQIALQTLLTALSVFTSPPEASRALIAVRHLDKGLEILHLSHNKDEPLLTTLERLLAQFNTIEHPTPKQSAEIRLVALRALHRLTRRHAKAGPVTKQELDDILESFKRESVLNSAPQTARGIDYTPTSNDMPLGTSLEQQDREIIRTFMVKKLLFCMSVVGGGSDPIYSTDIFPPELTLDKQVWIKELGRSRYKLATQPGGDLSLLFASLQVVIDKEFGGTWNGITPSRTLGRDVAWDALKHILGEPRAWALIDPSLQPSSIRNIDPQVTLHAVRTRIREVLEQLRFGTRPRLQIPGLTPVMEDSFRHQRAIERRDSDKILYRAYRTDGGETEGPASWKTLGFESRPGSGIKQAAHAIYLAWRSHEVIWPSGNADLAKRAFERTWTQPADISLLNAPSSTTEGAAGTIDFISEFLTFLPERVLRSGRLKSINLAANRSQGNRMAQWVEDRGELGIIRNPIPFDHYLSTALLLHEAGHIVRSILSESEQRKLHKLFEAFKTRRAWIGVDFMNQTAKQRIAYQQTDFKEFVAENYMHFVVLGREGMLQGEDPRSPRGVLRTRLYNFYKKALYPDSDQDPLARLDQKLQADQPPKAQDTIVQMPVISPLPSTKIPQKLRSAA